MQNSDLWRSRINFDVIQVKIATLIVDLVITGPRSKSLSMSWGGGGDGSLITNVKQLGGGVARTCFPGQKVNF